MADYIIKNGTVIDGSGRIGYKADVVIGIPRRTAARSSTPQGRSFARA